MTDYDPRLVDLYDADNPDGPDHDFYRALAEEVSADSVLDLGCGTGIPPGGFDYAVMSGNVAQHIPDMDWDHTLRELRQALKTGGTLAFESRNPAVRAWENWASDKHTTRETPHGKLIEWADISETAPGTVELVAHTLFAETKETVTETQLLVFRDRRTLEQQLNAAGFVVETVYGDWKRGPFTEYAPIMIFVARAR